MSGHIDVDVLSDLVEGLLSASRAAELAPHLAECDACRDTLDALREIRDLLGAQPVEPMPADVAARIDGALALAALPPPRAGDRPAEPPPTVVPLERARRRRRGPGLLLAAAATAAVVTLGVVIVDSGGRDDAKNADGSAQAPARSPYSGGAEKPQNNAQEPNSGAAPNHDEAPTPEGAATRPYTDAELAARINLLLHDTARAGRPVPPCVSSAIGRDAVAPLATDFGTYRGHTAWIVVAAGDAADRVSVYIVDAACASGPSTGPSHLTVGGILLHTEVTRT